MTVRWTSTAQDDLDRIYDFIAQHNLDAAGRMLGRLFEAGERLKAFSSRGRPGRIVGTRELVVTRTPYFIVYAKEGGGCVILRVMHGARQWPPEGESAP